MIFSTCSGVHRAASEVKPTISLKYIVTQEKLSAVTDLPSLRSSAIGLKGDNALHLVCLKLAETTGEFKTDLETEVKSFSFSNMLFAYCWLFMYLTYLSVTDN